jgi:hypothetical protein
MDLLPLLDFLGRGDWAGFWTGLGRVPLAPDFWLWFYLSFAVSSTMMPSASDRHAWRPLGLVLGGLFFLVLIAGAGPWMLANLAPPFNSFLQALALILGFSAVIHLILILPSLLLHRALAKLTGIDVE